MSEVLSLLRRLTEDPANSDLRADCWKRIGGPAKVRFAGNGPDRPFRMMAADVAERICMQTQSYERWVPILSAVLDALGTPQAPQPELRPAYARAADEAAVSAWADRKDIGGD